VAEAVYQVVVDHAHGLHEGVADRGAHEGEAALPELPAHGVGLRRAAGHLPQALPRVLFRPAAGELPDEPIEAPELPPHGEQGPGIPDRAADLQLVAHDPRIGQELLHPGVPVGGDPIGVEAVEGPAVVLPLSQDGEPGKAGLGAFQNQELEEPPVVVDGNAPLPVVVVAIERIVARPGAPPFPASFPRITACHRVLLSARASF
jgi:hypothetical protein